VCHEHLGRDADLTLSHSSTDNVEHHDGNYRTTSNQYRRGIMPGLIDEGIATVIGAITGERAKVLQRTRSGFRWDEFMRAEGGVVGQTRGLSQEIKEGRYQELPRGELDGSTTIKVLGRCAEIGTPIGWAAQMPSEGTDSAICAALYRTDAGPSLVYSLHVLALSHVQAALDPALWLLEAERTTGLRAVGRVMCTRLAGQPAYLWHMAGTMPGAAVGRPQQGMVEVRSSELWCPLPDGTARMRLVAPPERMAEGQQAFSALASSWRWMPAHARG
jgi:hypothetical protein